MKIKKKNFIYKLRFDGTLLEYSASNSVSRAFLKLFSLSYHVEVPVNHVLLYNAKRCLLGVKHSYRVIRYNPERKGALKTREIKSIWLLNNRKVLSHIYSALDKVKEISKNHQNVALIQVRKSDVNLFYDYHDIESNTVCKSNRTALETQASEFYPVLALENK